MMQSYFCFVKHETRVCKDKANVSDRTSVDGITNQGRQRKEPCPNSFQKEQFFLSCEFNEDLGLLCIYYGQQNYSEGTFLYPSMVSRTEHACQHSEPISRCYNDENGESLRK